MSRNEGFNIPPGEAGHYWKSAILSDIPIHRELYPRAQLIKIQDISKWSEALSSIFPTLNTKESRTESDYSRLLEEILGKIRDS